MFPMFRGIQWFSQRYNRTPVLCRRIISTNLNIPSFTIARVHLTSLYSYIACQFSKVNIHYNSSTPSVHPPLHNQLHMLAISVQQRPNVLQLPQILLDLVHLLRQGRVSLHIEPLSSGDLVETPQVPPISGSLEIVVRFNTHEVAVHNDGGAVGNEVGDGFHDVPGVVPPDEAS